MAAWRCLRHRAVFELRIAGVVDAIRQVLVEGKQSPGLDGGIEAARSFYDKIIPIAQSG